jgi:phosphoribosyl-ATP pyrophosphohydrolase
MKSAAAGVFARLFQTIESRKQASPSSSYTARLFGKGVPAINDKIREEAGEVCEAGLEPGTAHLVHEIADLLFHTFVLASHRGLGLGEIEAELARRFGKSGLEEKAERKGND